MPEPGLKSRDNPLAALIQLFTMDNITFRTTIEESNLTPLPSSGSNNDSHLGGFCRDPIWNATIAWNSTHPRLTQCFQDTVLVGLPAATFIVFSLFWPYYLVKASTGYRDPPPKLKLIPFILKHLFTLCHVIGTCLRVYARIRYLETLSYSDYVPLVALAICYVVSYVWIWIEKRKQHHSSKLFFYFYLLHVFCSVPQFLEDIYNLLKTPPVPGGATVAAIPDALQVSITVLSGTPLLLAHLVCHAFAAIRTGDDSVPMESKASHVSNIFFSWMDGIIWKGYFNPLLQAELPPSPKQVDVTANVNTFLGKWDSYVASFGISMTNKKETDKQVSIWPVLLRTYGKRFFLSSVLGLFHYLIAYANPVLLKALIKHIQSKEEEAWKGYFYTILMLAASTAWTISFHVFIHQMVVVAIQMRSSVVAAIYRKALSISNNARSKYTVGEITNYMSVDAQRILESIPFLPSLWAAPLQVAVAMYFLYNELGIFPSLGGLGVLCLLIPLNAWGTKVTESLQEKQLEAKDNRIKLMNEILPGMKVLKLYAWELPFMKRVTDVRDKEIKVLKHSAYLWAMTNFTFACSPFLVTMVVFLIYTAIDPVNNVLDASKIFVSISLLNIMRIPLVMFPWAIADGVKMFVSINRISRFLNAEELDRSIIGSEVEDSGNDIELKDATFAWGDSKQAITNVSLKIPTGSITAIVGSVASGKSSLISAMIGEMDLVAGSINWRGRDRDLLQTAYVPQQAWIQNLTLRNNILFDRPYVRSEYKRVINACALQPDLDMLASGDSTEIGESGINLSGGQKQRVSIARAAYSNKDVYFFDDPLSACDAHVGKEIFEKVLSSKTGLLKEKTRIIATNALNFLKEVDNIIVLRDGKIGEQGSYDELVANKGAFADFLAQYAAEDHKKDDGGGGGGGSPRKVVRQTSESSANPIPFVRSTSVSSDTILGSTPTSAYRILSRRTSIMEEVDRDSRSSMSEQQTREERDLSQQQLLDRQVSVDDDQQGRLIEEEAAMLGRVKWGVYFEYAKSVGLVAAAIAVFMYIVGQGLHSGGNVWLSYWSDFNEKHPDKVNQTKSTFLGVYGGLGVAESFVELTRDLMLFLCCARASKNIHTKLLYSVMRSPMSFFDTNPTGRIVNRFSADIDTIDLTIPFQLSDFLWCACEVASALIIISYSTPMFMTVIVPLAVVYFMIQKYYITSSRQLKRLESISKSPIFSHFTESVNGTSTIRVYNQFERFVRESEDKVAANVRCNYLNYSSNRWLGIRIESLGNLIIFFAAIFTIIGRDGLTGGKAGLSIMYAMQITDTLNWLVRMVCDLETNCVSLERVLEYANTNPQEAKWEQDDAAAPPLPEDWPRQGQITLEDYQTRYRPGLDLVLKGVSLDVDDRMKVGICGRTGAGKSSLTLALFRIIEPASGRIIIDDYDISQMGLHELRSRLTIIPQDPVLFTGTVRFNLDPTSKSDDTEIWTALEHAHLKAYIQGLDDGLDTDVTEGGSNFSVGQRQLMCLARALLRKPKILVLDEATAAIDVETDDLIQKTIRREFNECTVITIAHRLNTIMDSDRIAVLSAGKVIEYDSPDALMAKEDSALASMAKDANLR